MNILLYNFNKRTNSTKTPDVDGVIYDVVLKDGTNIYNPVFTMKNYDSSLNYCKWENRFYFVNNVRIDRYNVYTITCNIDVLATYKQEIKGTTAYVRYSASSYHYDINDDRIPTKSNAVHVINSAQLITDGTITGDGTYIISYITDTSTYGCGGVLWANTTMAQSLANKLTDTNFLNMENFEKQFSNAYQSLLGCRYVPFTWYTKRSPNTPFKLGSYNTGVNGAKIIQFNNYECDIEIPYQYIDFRRNEPYSTYMIYLPRYGIVPISRGDIIGKTSLHVKLTVDGVTGEGTYTIDNIFKGTTNFGVSIAIGTVASNVGGILSGAVQLARGRATGNVLGMVTGAVSFMGNSMQRSVGNVGNNGSLSSLFATIGDDWTKVYFVSISHDTQVEPYTVKDTIGRPLMECVQISTLSGYCQTDGFSVARGNADINEQINNLMDGGVFIE